MKKVLVICGPTASGKSAFALREAMARGGEIVSADSMQLYRDLPVGTAQVPENERKDIPHHLVGIYPLDARAEVFSYQKMADEVIDGIISRGKLPVVCGGTGMYIRALICGLDDLPADRELRAELDAQYDSDDAEERLFEKMSELDPAALEKWKSCRRRLLRALEVRLISGKSILELQKNAPERRYDAEVILLDPPADKLKETIRRRAEIMLDNGWIEEAEAAIARGLFETPTAHQAIGYRQIADHLAGKLSKAELIEKISTVTWQYARRQRTWFRHQEPHPDKVIS